MPEILKMAEEIEKLKKLLDDGILTQEEFDIQKKKLLYADNTENNNQNQQAPKTKFCKHCGESIDIDCIICPKCGKQVEELKAGSAEQPKIEVNVNQNQSSVNTNTNTIHAGMLKKPKDKWVAVLLCFFIGYLGAHKFYEGKVGMGILYILTFGLFTIGWIIDFIVLLFKPNPYYV